MCKKSEFEKDVICKVEVVNTLYEIDGYWYSKEQLYDDHNFERKLPKGTVLTCKFDPNEKDLPEDEKTVHGYTKNGHSPICWMSYEDLYENQNVREVLPL